MRKGHFIESELILNPSIPYDERSVKAYDIPEEVINEKVLLVQLENVVVVPTTLGKEGKDCWDSIDDLEFQNGIIPTLSQLMLTTGSTTICLVSEGLDHLSPRVSSTHRMYPSELLSRIHFVSTQLSIALGGIYVFHIRNFYNLPQLFYNELLLKNCSYFVGLNTVENHQIAIQNKITLVDFNNIGSLRILRGQYYVEAEVKDDEGTTEVICAYDPKVFKANELFDDERFYAIMIYEDICQILINRRSKYEGFSNRLDIPRSINESND